MAASANPSGNQEGSHSISSYNGVASGGNTCNGNSGAVSENSGLAHTLKHNPGLSTEWTAEEQSILDEGLSKYASESSMVCYAMIAMELQDKTVRDVALRRRWMTVTKKESSKRRKEDRNSVRKNKDKKEKVTDPLSKVSSQLGARPNVPRYALPNFDGISYEAIGGATRQMLEQNAQAFNQISANLAAYQIRENINLFCQARNNIFKILNGWNDFADAIYRLPPFLFNVNEELANSILPRTILPMQS